MTPLTGDLSIDAIRLLHATVGYDAKAFHLERGASRYKLSARRPLNQMSVRNWDCIRYN